MTSNLFMVFDVESIGLHGEGFSVGYVVLEDGVEIDSAYFWTEPGRAIGTREDHLWVEQNVPVVGADVPSIYGNLVAMRSPREVRQAFWDHWMVWKGRGAVLVADCPWPVEGRFLNQCIEDDREGRLWLGPYPLIGVESIRLAAGLDPLETAPRSEGELPVHHPLADARQSARLLLEALAGCGR